MFRVEDCYDEAKRVVGNCSDTKLFRWLGDAVSLIANKGDFEGWKGWIDMCVDCNQCITLPREVDTVIGVNIGGHPTLGYGQLFNFHLNGPGDCTKTIEWSWQDQGKWHATFHDIQTPSKVVAYLESAADNGKQLLVYGFDYAGRPLRRQEGGVWLNGYRVPTIFGVAVPDANAPVISRITDIDKAETVGSVRLSTIDDSGLTGTLLGIYEPDEQIPRYRRIKLGRAGKLGWVRVAYRKNDPTFSSRWDHVPLFSRLALLNAVRACKFYADNDLANAHGFEADAVRMELEAQSQREAPTFTPIQVVGTNDISDKFDYDIR